jgi:nicotinamidase-related amidase
MGDKKYKPSIYFKNSLLQKQLTMDEQTALIIIDIQNDYFEGGAHPLSGSLEASLKAKHVLGYFRKKKLPVIHVQHISTRPGATFLLPGTKGIGIHKNVEPVEGEKVIVKHFPNSFRETDLLDSIKGKHIQHLVICGMMTQMCVDATVRAAKDHGLTCTLLSDACATMDLEIHGQHVLAAEVQKSYLAALSYFYATVVKTNDFLLVHH